MGGAERLRIAPEIREALAAGAPVVALETTIVSHGMPYPENVETARALEREIRGRGATPATIAVLDEIDEIFLVTTLEVPSLHQAKQAVQTLINAGFGSRLRVILNRTPQRPDVTAEELERILGAPIDTMLPNDYYALYDAFCKGKLLPPGSHLNRQMASFAMRLAGAPVEKGKRRFGLFG